jgi:hypothetical protein
MTEWKQGGVFEATAAETGQKKVAPHPLADMELCQIDLAEVEKVLIKQALGGSTVGRASIAAGISEGKGRKMLFRLVDMGVLVARKIEGEHRWGFTSGERAYAYSRALAEYIRDGRPGSPKLLRVGFLRVHRSAWRFRLHSPLARVAWETRSDPAGLGYATDFRLSKDGVGFWMKSVRGEPATLVVEPLEIHVFNPELTARAEPMLRQAAIRGAVGLLEEFGGSMDGGSTTRIAPTEYGLEVDGLAPFGRPGVDVIWADRSLGGDRVEVETQNPVLAARLLEWFYDEPMGPLSEVVAKVAGGQP